MAVIRVASAADGTPANGPSDYASLSADGTRIVFASQADNLVPGDTNGEVDIFLKDLVTGAVTRVSTTASGDQANGSSIAPSLSADGTKVAFRSTADNLVAGDTNGARDVFVKDLNTGAVVRASVAADGREGSLGGFNPVLSPDGSKVAFQSYDPNLVAGDTAGDLDVFVKNLTTGALTRVSTPALEPGSSLTWSSDGSKLAFAATRRDLPPGQSGNNGNVYVKDLGNGRLDLVSRDAGGRAGNGDSISPSFSADGTKIAFASNATSFVAGDTNNRADVFVKNLSTGSNTRASIAGDGTQSNGGSVSPVLSPDGTKVAFSSDASNLVPGDTNGHTDVFVKDLTTGAITRLPGTETSAKTPLAVSGDGTRLAFLETEDATFRQDVFATDVAMCFVTGTGILTTRGAITVETLRIGDRVVTASGARRPVVWIGRRSLGEAGRPLPVDSQPVRIRAGAFGDGLPERDLFLSQGHPVLVGDHLVPVMCLVNGTTIARMPVETVTYWHVELDAHDILLAEGLPAESYLDLGSRPWFSSSILRLYDPDLVPAGSNGRCRPVALDGPVVEAERRRLDALFRAAYAAPAAWSAGETVWAEA
ncbi:Hint domain-containing protein [uncultured Methylobacterium sp.]|jgi:Tol biopolymer transport system component|uniref:Hint domain-containing protein n=1 Tax=uncultured Methylobacterium sp. TaxID=157278 RepID=UPI002638E5D5|nr:Hint domain-containing protein [uncultured Methylobacterium sp.]